jgi:hypothetical protein
MCPTRAVLQADVEQLMGRRVFTSQAEARVILRGAVLDGPRGVSVRIEAADARGNTLGTRELRAAAGQCAALRDAIGLVLTLFVEYEGASTAERDTRLGFGAELSLAEAPLPRMAWSVGPVLWLALGPVVQLQASGAYWPAVSIRTARGVGATLEALSLKLRGCARIWAGLGLCGGIESGVVVSEPLQLRGPQRQVRLLAQGLLEASWELTLVDVARVDVAGGALLSLHRPAFSYSRSDGERMAVYRPQLAGMILRVTVIITGE